jgi:hypothetical protein
VQLETDGTIITGLSHGIQVNPEEQSSASLLGKANRNKNNIVSRNITLALSEKHIQQALQHQAFIDIASDGSHDQVMGSLSYGWVITINDEIAATGHGPAASHPSLAGSYRAEAYGLAAAATFVHHMIEHYNVQEPGNHIWHIYLDNKTLINKIEQYRSEMLLPKWNLNPDADIVLQAHNLLQQIPVTFVHVKSHGRSSNSTKQPSRAEQLNSSADELATRQKELTTEPTTNIQSTFCHLKINDTFITKDSQHWILDIATRIPMQQYYYDKHGWSQDTFNNIDWEIQYKALKSYDINDQRRIVKLVHGWLPTNDRMHRELQSSTQRCPLCFYISETNIHLFSCKHIKQAETVQELHDYLKDDNSENKSISAIIGSALRHSIENPKWQPAATDTAITPSIQAQSKIGWQQVFLGRIAKTITERNGEHSDPVTRFDANKRGKRWKQKLIRKIWDTYLKLWKQRNEIIHGTQERDKNEIQRQRLTTRLERCYQYQSQLRVRDQNKIFYKTIDEIKQEDPRLIQSWLKICERLIRIHKKEAKKPNQMKTMMEQFVQWKPSQKVKRKRATKTPHQKHDLRPD